jgi:Arc/MetJ-type ribon-helix-helix transcriptional regulator
VVGVTNLSVRINDDELEAFLADRESDSETVRKALRYLRAQEEGIEDERLTEHQRAAYQWLRDRVGVGNSASVPMVENQLAQRLSVDMSLIRSQVLRPLERHGYTAVQARVSDSRLRVLPPVEHDAQQVDDAEDAGERMDELVAAEAVSGRAD